MGKRSISDKQTLEENRIDYLFRTKEGKKQRKASLVIHVELTECDMMCVVIWSETYSRGKSISLFCFLSENRKVEMTDGPTDVDFFIFWNV